MTTLDVALAYLDRYGWQSIPLPQGSKRPFLKGWQKLHLSKEELPDYFNGSSQNIGVLLGQPSGGLLDVDLDCSEALLLAPHFLPETLTFGRKSKPRSHWLYVADPLPDSAKYQLPGQGDQGKRPSEMLVELRSTGGQTMFPPSRHPGGEQIAFTNEGEPLRIDRNELTLAVRHLAVACVFLRRWPRATGARQDHAQALAGALIRSGLAKDVTEHFIYVVALCAGDEEAAERARTASYAATRKADGEVFWGWPKVAEYFGEDAANAARTWLGVKDGAHIIQEKEVVRDLGEAPALPQHAYELLPDIMREAVSYFNAWHKRDVFLTALLGVLSSALPNVRFLYGQQYHSPHLFFFVLARAASGKGVMVHAFRWVDTVDESLQREWLEEMEVWQRQKDEYERAKRSRKKSLLDPDPPGPEPPERCLKAGANTTAAALGKRLAANPHGVFIGSTEGDTLSSSNKREHGNFSHIMRQAFHHEQAQVDRKTESTLRIRHPRLALVLSGTLKQFPRFMDGGVEDGLYSRFGVYSFEAPAVFESQWATAKDTELEAFTERAQRRVLKLYKLLRNREKPLYFDVPEHLRARVTDSFVALHDALVANRAFDLLPTVLRGVVITLRIAAVLTVWRHFEKGTPLGKTQNLMASEEDVEAAVALGLVYVEHALREALRIEPGIGQLPDTCNVGGGGRMTGKQRGFFDALPPIFKTADAVAQSKSLEVPRSTMFHWLGRWVEAKLLEKHGQGQYQKRQVSGEGVNRSGLLDSLDFPANSRRNADSPLDFPMDLSREVLDTDAQSSNNGNKVQSKVHSETRLGGSENGQSPIVQQSSTVWLLHVGQRVETSQGLGTIEEIPGKHQKVKVDVDALSNTPMPVRAFDASDLNPLEEIRPEQEDDRVATGSRDE